VGIDEISLMDDEFPAQYGLDAGTLNPRGFTNGLTIDVAHTATARVPSDLELHRRRTIFVAVHSNDHRVLFEDSWEPFDGDSSSGRLVQAPRDTRNPRESVHVLALYLSESHHLADIFGGIDGIMYLDGPIYPLGLLRWVEADPSLGRSDLIGEVFSNYFETYERALKDGVPVVGFVKSTTTSRVLRRLRNAETPPVPWSNDTGFFRHFLSAGMDGDVKITFTDWFVSRFYEDTLFDVAPPDAPSEGLLPACMYVHDPRHGTVHRVEAPCGVVRDGRKRKKITRQTLKEVALNRVPRAVDKADSLACVSNEQRESLIRRFEKSLGTTEERNYNRDRWGYVRSSMGLTL